MSHAIDIPRDDNEGTADLFVDGPVVDLLYYEPEARAYVVTFIPEQAVSRERTESVQIPVASPDGQQIGKWLEELGRALKLPGSVRKLFHRGGSEFGFYGPGNSEDSLPQRGESDAASQHVYAALRELAQTAQTAFLLSRRPPANYPDDRG